MATPIRLDFAASTSQARTQINALAATIDNLQEKMLKASGLQGNQLGAVTTLQGSLAAASDELENMGGRKINLSEPIRQTEKLVDNINKGKISWDDYRRAAGASSKVVAQQLALQRAEISNIRRESSGKLVADFDYGNIVGTTTSLERLAMQARVTGAAGRALGQEWVDVGKNMAFSARQLTISLTAPFTVVSALSMKAYMDTSEALTDIAKVYGDSADGFSKSADQIKAEARDLARAMSDAYAASYKDTYEHQKFYAAQGLTGADLAGSTQQAVRLQMLGDVDPADAQQAITTLTNVYGVQTEKMGQYVDYMNKIEDSTTLTMQDFAAAMPKIGPIIKSFEEDPKEATKAMAEMLEAGKRGGIQSATEIANAWKSIYTKVARPTEQLKDVWQELGQKNGLADSFMGIVTKNGGDVMAIVKEISMLTADWNDVDKNRLFSQLAGAQQVARMTTFAEQLSNSNDTIKEINAEFDNNPDSLADNSRRQQDLIMESAEKRWAQFVNKIRDVGTTVGMQVFQPIMNILETGAGFLEKLANGFSAVPGPLKDILKIVGGFAVVLGPAIGVIGALIQVSGQFFKIWSTGMSAVGTSLNKFATGVGSKKLLTVSDVIRDKTSKESFQNEMNLALLQSEQQAASDKLVGSFNRLSTSVDRAASKLGAVPSAMEKAPGTGLTEKARARREAMLTPATPPKERSVFVPPKPVEPVNKTPENLSRYAIEQERHERGKRLKAEADTENRVALAQFRQHEEMRKRIESRYKSFTNYMESTPQAILDDNYQNFRQTTAPQRLQNSEFMREIRSQLNSGVIGTTDVGSIKDVRAANVQSLTNGRTTSIISDGNALLNRQRVADQLAYTNRDIAVATNKRNSVPETSPKWLATEKQIQAAKAEQSRLNGVLKGSTADIAKEAAKIEQSYAGTTKSGLQFVKGVVPSMRRQADDFIRTNPAEILPGRTIAGERTGLTKSGIYQASDRTTRKTIRQALKRDPNAFAAYEDNQFAQTNIPIAGRKASGNLQLTPEIYSQAVRQSKNLEASQTSLARLQSKITDNSAEYAANIANTAAAAGSLLLMFSGDNPLLQTLGAITTGFGLVFSAVPSLAEKAFEKIGGAVAPAINNVSSFFKNALTGGAEGFASGIVGNLQAKFVGFSSWLKANSAALMGWGAAIAAAAAVGYLALNKLEQSSREYREELERGIARGKELSSALGYVYSEPLPSQGTTGGIEDSIKEAANALKEIEGFDKVIGQLGGRDIKLEEDITAMQLALKPEAIKILASGGTEADVNKMVKAALYAAGADQATIDNFKLNINLDNMEDILPQSQIDSITDRISGAAGQRGYWEQRGAGLGNKVKDFVTFNWGDLAPSVQMDKNTYRASAEEEANSIFNTYKEALAVAGDEVRPQLTQSIMDSITPDPNAPGWQQDRFKQIREQLVNQFATINGAFNDDKGKELLGSSDALLNALIGQEGTFKSAQEASDQYQIALKELADAGINVDTNTRRMISNVFRTAAGMEKLDQTTGKTARTIDQFDQATTEPAAAPKGFKELLADFANVGREGQSATAVIGRMNPVLATLGNQLNNLPGDFNRRWSFYIDINNPTETGAQIAGMMRESGTKSMNWGADFAARQMDNQHQATLDSIKSAGDSSLKALEGQQKASEKAMKAQEKALDGKHKAQSKALDKQIKEEEKQFDNQQKAEKKNFDKRQKEDKKLFDKDIERQKKDFDAKWKTQEDAIKSYYDASRKYIEGQQAAEDKLDKSRQRNAEAERKRQEMLNDLANKNVDINVALAGGNLDEAAKLMNDANAASQTYYANAGQSLSDAQSEDRSAARQARLSGLSEQEQIANSALSSLKEKDTEQFNLGIESQQEAFSEKQAGESETFQDKMDRQKEEFQLQFEARREQLQLQQEQEKEFLAMRREAEAEFYAAQREQIQATTDASLKSQEQVHNSRKENMALELELLKIGSATTEKEVTDSANRLLETYGRYGVDLSAVGDKLQGGMIENFHAGMDQAAAKIREDAKWQDVGTRIGALLQAGLDEGFSFQSGELIHMLLTGQMPASVKNNLSSRAFSLAANSNRDPSKPVGKATGGAIFGPGTGTSDSIPAMLSNGEHVITAAEVQAAGGHAAIERWRKQILSGTAKRFAVGGAVGATSSLSGTGGLTITVNPTGTGGVSDGGVLGAVSADVQSMGQTFDATMAQTVAPAWQLFGDQLIKVREDAIRPTFEAMQEAMANVQAETTNTTAGVMAPAWYLFGQNLLNYKTTMWDFAVQQMQSGLTSLSTATTTALTNQMTPAWQQAANHVMNMQNTVIDPAMRATRDATDQTARNFGTAADMIGTGWSKVKENTASPVRFTIDTVFNKGLVGMWNNVAEALDLETFKEHPLTFATGGVLPGYTPGRDVHKFSSPTGGQLHLSGGEAIMRPEWTRAVGGPSAVAQMNNDAKTGKMSPVREPVKGLNYVDGPGPVQKFAEGGVVGAKAGAKLGASSKWDYSQGPNPAVKGGTDDTIHNGSRMTTPIQFAMWDAVRSAFPGVRLTSATRTFMTEGRPDNHNGGTALDLSPSADVARWIYKNYRSGMKELIHVPTAGWSNVLSGQDAVWTQNNHYDHVHWAQGSMVNPWSGGVVNGGDLGGWGSAGGGGLSALALKVLDDWNTAKSDLEKKVEKFTTDSKSGVAKAIPEAMMGKMVEGMEQSFMSKLPTGSAGNTPIDWNGLPADIKSNIELGKFAAEQAGWTGAEWEALKTLWHNESGWDNNAQNPTSTAYGIAQFLDSTWASFGPKTSDPKKQIEYGIQYIKSRPDYGGPGNGTPARALAMWQSRSPHWYDEGGLAYGKGAMMKNVVEPERVLSPQQTKSFDSLVNVLDRSFGSSVRRDTLSTPISGDDYMSKLTNLDLTNRPSAMSEKEYNPKSQEEITKSLQPIFNAFQSFIQQQVVPGVIKYTTELIQMKTDEERLAKVSGDIIAGIEGIHIPSNNEVNMVFGGTVYGDGHLTQIMEDYKRQILSEVRAISDEAARRVAGK